MELFVPSYYNIFGEEAKDWIKKMGVKDFGETPDRMIVENVAYSIAEELLEKQDHNPKTTKKLGDGFDGFCDHCDIVYEVKGHSRPSDVNLTRLETLQAEVKRENYILIIVFNLPDYSINMIEDPYGKNLLTPKGDALIKRSDLETSIYSVH